MKDIQNVIVVTGAMYGDEGKGSVVYDACQRLQFLHNKPVVIKHNGTGQAGHTVKHNGELIVHKTFGSGTLLGVPTILAKTFVVCPMTLVKEARELKSKFNLDFNELLIVDNACAVILPWDKEMNMNRDNEHGTCGYGLFESIQRHKVHPVTIENLYMWNSFGVLEEKLIEIRDNYYKDKCNLYGDELIHNWCNDVREMLHDYIFHVYTDWMKMHIRDNFDSFVFEGGQGLGLSQFNIDEFPHLTPSFTGGQNVLSFLAEICNKNKSPYIEFSLDNFRVIYVSRPYLTRHGSGPLKYECKLEDLPILPYEETNVYNEFQGDFRYGYFDTELFLKHVIIDIKLYQTSLFNDGEISQLMKEKEDDSRIFKTSVTFTQLDYIVRDEKDKFIITKEGLYSLDELIVRLTGYLDKELKSAVKLVDRDKGE